MAEELKHRRWCFPEDGEGCACFVHLRDVEPIRDEEIDGLLDLALHYEVDDGGCAEDGDEWPCAHARLGGRLWSDRAEIKRLREEVARLRRGCRCCAGSQPLEGVDERG